MKTIGIGAFRESGLENIALPQSIKTVGAYSFYKCDQLRTVKLGKSLEMLGAKECVNGEE